MFEKAAQLYKRVHFVNDLDIAQKSAPGGEICTAYKAYKAKSYTSSTCKTLDKRSTLDGVEEAAWPKSAVTKVS